MDYTQRLFILGVILALTFGMGVGQVAPAAATTPPPGPTRVVFMNFGEVLQGTEESKIKIAQSQTYVDGKNRENDAKGAELEKLKAEFNEKVRMLNPQSAGDMQREIAKKERELTRFREDIQSDIDGLREQLFSGLTQKIQTVIADAAAENGYSAVLFIDQLQGYFNPAFNITADIVQRYNAKYPVSAAEAAAPAGSGQ